MKTKSTSPLPPWFPRSLLHKIYRQRKLFRQATHKLTCRLEIISHHQELNCKRHIYAMLNDLTLIPLISLRDLSGLV